MRKASSMIELVIAIVVMGIAVMTLPLMLEQTQKGNSFAMQQEAILVARTQIGDILTYPWDENSIQDGVVGVLDVTSSAFGRYSEQRRVGHVRQDKRRKFFTNSTQATTTLGQEGSNYNDIDDFSSGSSKELVILNEDTASGLGYKFDLKLNTTVSYVDYNDSGLNTSNSPLASTNVKMIELSIKDTNDIMTPFKLRAYSTNIGGNYILRRDWK